MQWNSCCHTDLPAIRCSFPFGDALSSRQIAGLIIRTIFATRTAIPPRWSPPSSFCRPNPSFRVIQQPRRAQSRIGYGRRRPQYNRFSRAQQLYGLWKTSPTFRIGVGAAGAGAGTFYVYNLEDVPVRLYVERFREAMSLMRLWAGIGSPPLQLRLAQCRAKHGSADVPADAPGIQEQGFAGVASANEDGAEGVG